MKIQYSELVKLSNNSRVTEEMFLLIQSMDNKDQKLITDWLKIVNRKITK